MKKKLELEPSELLILKKILVKNGMSKRFVNQAASSEILDAVCFIAANKELIKFLRKGMKKSCKESCSCELDKMKKKK